jgi:hypothetical protein
MAKGKTKTTVCSFCLNDIPNKELYVVALPMHRLPEGGYTGEYRTSICGKCISKEKDRYLRIHEEPKSSK